MALRTTVVGSWWKLDEHEDQLARYHRGELDLEQGDDLLNRAAAAAIDEQRALGLDEWTGGEYFTDNFIDHMQRVLHGFEIDKPDEPDPFDYDDLAHAVITGELSAPQGLGYAAAYRRESKLPGGVRKATLVGPLEITVHAQDQREELARQMPNLVRMDCGILAGLVAEKLVKSYSPMTCAAACWASSRSMCQGQSHA